MPAGQIASSLLLRRLGVGVRTSAIPAKPDQAPIPAERLLAEHGELALRAVCQATRHAWLALEIAFAGQGIWKPISQDLAPAKGNVLRQQLDALLDLLSLAGLESEDVNSRRRCLEELRSARRAGLLVAANLEELKRDPGSSFRNGAPAAAETGESARQAVAEMTRTLWQAGYPQLARLVGLRTPWEEPLFWGLVEYFMCRALRAQPELVHNLSDPPENHAAASWRCLEMTARLLEEREGAVVELLNRPEEAVADGTPHARDEEAIERLFQLGLSRYLHGEYQQAAAQFTAALKLDPTDARLYAHRGDAYRLQCEYERAIADFHAALRLKPSNPAVLVSRAMAYHFSGEHECAVADCSAALEFSPNNATAYRIRAAAYADLSSPHQALADLAAAITLAPEDDEARYQRGVIHVNQREYGKAIADFDRALALSRHHVPAYLHRAHAHRCRTDFASAIRDYNEVLRHHPNHVLALIGRGSAHRLQGDLNRALADYAEALRLEPGNARAHLSRGLLYRLKGDLAQSQADLDEALRHEPENGSALYHRSKIFLALGQTAPALADLTQALSLHPKLVVAHLSRAVIHDRLGRYEEGVADGSRAVQLDARSAAAYLVRGIIYGHMGEYASAINDLTEAIRLDERLALAHLERGVAYTVQRDYDRALVDCNRALALEPRNAQAYANRSILHHFKGDVSQALVDYAQAMQLNPQCIMTAWNPCLAESARLQTNQRLADYIDGLRHEAAVAEGPPAPRIRIVLKPNRAGRAPSAGPGASGAGAAPCPPGTNVGALALAESIPMRQRAPKTAPAVNIAAGTSNEMPILDSDPAPSPDVDAAIGELLLGPSETSAEAELSLQMTADDLKIESNPASVPQLSGPAPARSPYRPARTPPRAVEKDAGDDDASFLAKWKKPHRLAAAGIALVGLVYFGFWFGRSDHVPVYPARGQAFFEGKPIPQALIMFEPLWTKEPKFPRPRAVVKDDGSFAVETYGKEDGAPPGEYKVLVQWLLKSQEYENEGGGLPRNYLPLRYGQFATSGLKVTIEKGETQLPAFQLTR
jgi:tetratricopeptide (TPR) repeat protein